MYGADEMCSTVDDADAVAVVVYNKTWHEQDSEREKSKETMDNYYANKYAIISSRK